MPSASRVSHLVRLVLVAVVFGAVTTTGVMPAAHAASEGRLVLVLDSSGSMKEKVGGDTKISIAKKALGTVIDKLPGDAAVGLRVYGATVFDRSEKGACSDSQLVVPIGTGNRAALKDEIKKYRPYGETPISYSLKQAAEDLGDSGKRTVVLVSDGEETCKVDPCVTAASLAKQGIDLKFDVIGLRVSGKARSQLQCIADKGHGTYYDADNAEQIEDSLDKLATRAFRPFKLTGTPIEGSTKRAGAPEATPGQYTDQFPGDDAKLYYRIPRTAPGSTLHVGMTAEAAGFVPTTYLRLMSGTSECDSGLGQVVNVGGTKNVISAQAMSWSRTEDSTCNSAPELTLVLNDSGDLAGRPFELLIREEPPIVSARHLQPPERSISWQKMTPAKSGVKPPVPGTSISDSPVLVPGTYTTSILTGEKQVYAVDLTWGQRVQVQAVIAPRKGALARALSVSDSMDVQLLGPMRGEYRSLPASGMPDKTITMADDDEPYRVAATTPTIRYLNRTTYSSQQYASIPGPQYIVISKSRVKNQAQFLIPLTLVVQVYGTAGDGAPEYTTPETPSPTPSPSPSPTPAPSTTPLTETSDGLSTGAVIGIAAGAVVVGAGASAGGGLALRRRRSS